MGNIAAIDGVTGPGRRTTLIGEVKEITFKLEHKTISVTNTDGTVGEFDLKVAKSVRLSINNDEFVLSVTAKEDTHD